MAVTGIDDKLERRAQAALVKSPFYELQELRVECFFPMDDATAAFCRDVTGGELATEEIGYRLVDQRRIPVERSVRRCGHIGHQ